MYREVREQAVELFDYEIGDEFRILSPLHTEETDWSRYQVKGRMLMLDYGELEKEYPDADELSKRQVYDLAEVESGDVITEVEIWLKDSNTVERVNQS